MKRKQSIILFTIAVVVMFFIFFSELIIKGC